MPEPQFKVQASVSCAATRPWGGVRSALVGLFILACLVLPRLIWLPHVQMEEPAVRAADAWLDFFDPEFAVLGFAAAPPLDVRLGLVRPWPDEAEADVDVQLALWETWVWSWLPAEVERGYWMEGRFSPVWRATDAGQFNYKVTPSFNFEQKGLRPSGVVIRPWINF